MYLFARFSVTELDDIYCTVSLYSAMSTSTVALHLFCSRSVTILSMFITEVREGAFQMVTLKPSSLDISHFMTARYMGNLERQT